MSGFIGILSLDTRFPRIEGDAGNPASWPLPARVRVVRGAGPGEIVRDGRPDPALLARFREAAEAFDAEGAALIVSTCGFLVSVQAEISEGLRAPVLLSGLSLAPAVLAMLGGRPLGILTAKSTALGPQALAAAGVPPGRARIAGLEHAPLFAGTFLAPRHEQNELFEPAAMEAEVVGAACALALCAPDIGAILLECGNLPPYAAAIGRATGLPVVSILDGARMMLPG